MNRAVFLYYSEYVIFWLKSHLESDAEEQAADSYSSQGVERNQMEESEYESVQVRKTGNRSTCESEEKVTKRTERDVGDGMR